MPLIEKGLVVRHGQVGPDLFEMELRTPHVAALCQPGQFIHVQVGPGSHPLLRRPLSIYDVDPNLGSVFFLYKVVGEGTALLSRIPNKDRIDAMGPLGKGFILPEKPCNALLIGGGVGIAPLIFLARTLAARNCTVRILHGSETRDHLAAVEKIRRMEVEFMPATLDGSAGFKGLVTDLLNEGVDPAWPDFIYTCGPEPMMAKVAEFSQKHNIPGQVSLEEHMACGVGACLGCARKLKAKDDDYAKICKDGPVFNMDRVELPMPQV